LSLDSAWKQGIPSNLIVAAVYVLSGILSLELAGLTQQPVVVLFPAGLAIALCISRPYQHVVPGIVVAAFFLHLWTLPFESMLKLGSYLTASMVAFSSVIQACVGSQLLKRWLPQPVIFAEDKQIMLFIALTPFIAVITASILMGWGWINGSALNVKHYWVYEWLGNWLGILLAFPVTMSFVGQPRERWRIHRLNLSLFMVVTTLIITLLIFKVNDVEREGLRERFQNHTQEFANFFQFAIQADELLLDSLTKLFVASEYVTRDEFVSFVRNILRKNHHAEEVKWMPKVSLVDRANYEARQQKYYGSDFSIKDLTSSKQLVTAKQREVYYPVTYIEPEIDNTKARGYDPTSSFESKSIINQVIASGEMKARAPLLIMRGDELKTALVMYQAVYLDDNSRASNDPREGKVAGLVSVTIKTEDFIQGLLKKTSPDFSIDWQDYDTGLYYFYQPDKLDSDLSYTVNFVVADRAMRIAFYPTQSFIDSTTSRLAFITLVVGHIMMALFALWLISMANRMYRVELLVNERTRQHQTLSEQAIASEQRMRILYQDMQKAEQQLQMSDVAFNSTTEAMMLTDEHVHVLAMNPAFKQLTGYSEKVILNSVPRFLVGSLNDQEYLHFSQQFWNNIERVGRWQGEVMTQRQSGETFPAYLAINAVFDNDHQLKNMVVFLSDLTEIKAVQAQIEQHANYDSLTQLPNRRLFADRLNHALLRAQREQENVCLMFLDLDRFKDVNDTLGHEVGDKLLQAIAKRITDCVREIDTVARLGGDEFTIIMEAFEMKSQAMNVAQKLIQEIEQPVTIDHHTIRVSTSIGITFFPDDAIESGVLIQNADRAMYAAKDVGGSAFKFYTSELESNWSSRTFIINELESALEKRELRVDYQPIVPVKKSDPTLYAEALVRWDHPTRGTLAPGLFLPQAEGMGLIEKIDDYVFKRVCEDIRVWNQQGLRVEVSVNRSAHNFGAGRGRVDWINYLTEQGLDGSQFTLEITESVLMQRQAESRHLIRKFREAGIRIAVDDFGTGYSSLSYLKEMEIDYIKIDRSFVRDLEVDENDRAIIRAITDMAKHLGIAVVAEGVETETQSQLLEEMGCAWRQGYHLAVPMLKVEFESYLEQRLLEVDTDDENMRMGDAS
jgi:diguanylate cyclase (GGDEF)-like protein/PAS domain S-box-containing protein